jgi:ribosomal protein S18 acetylase RimI-like enzyme
MPIEPATLADLSAVTDLWVDLATEQRPHGSHVRPAENRTAIRERLAAHTVAGTLLVDRADDRVVGFVSFEPRQSDLGLDAARGLVENIYVHPDYRGAGRGSALLDAAEAELRDRGVEVVQLEVMAANERARSFYAAHGYDEHRLVLEKRVGVESDTKGNDHD